MAEQNNENKNNINLQDILLPKKEVHAPDSAQRASAGVLLAQEQAAAIEGLKPAAAPTPAPAPTKKAEPKKEEPEVKPIQTYKSDVESLVQEKNVSVVSIATAEAEKREKSPLAAVDATTEEHWILKRVTLAIGGVLLIAVAAGALAYVFTRPTTVPVTPLSTDAPFITVDDTVQIGIDPTANPAAIMNTLNAARVGVTLSLGLVERLYITQGSDSAAVELPAQKFLVALAPKAPQALVRTLSGQYLLGVHSFDENQAFLIFHADAYETSYAAMLQWEPTMRQDLLPLFARTPPVRATTSAAATTATTTATSTTPSDFFNQPTQPLPTPDLTTSGIPTTFTDRVVENRDARVLQTKDGDIVLLWTFLDRNTLVITTNEFTLREVITRAAKAPTIPLPQ